MHFLFTALRRFQAFLPTVGTRHFLTQGMNFHVGRGSRLWAPSILRIGYHVYIGEQVHIEANCEIGDYCLIANRVAIIGRSDHGFSAVGFPMRYSPWIVSKRFPSPHLDIKAVIEPDVWLGYGAVVLTGVTIGRGSVIAACSVVSKDTPPCSIAVGVPAIAQHVSAILKNCLDFFERSNNNLVFAPANASTGRL